MSEAPNKSLPKPTISIASMVSIISMIVSIFGAYAAYQQAKIAQASEFAFLHIATKFDTQKETHGIYLTNEGKGVATIRSIKVTNKNKENSIILYSSESKNRLHSREWHKILEETGFFEIYGSAEEVYPLSICYNITPIKPDDVISHSSSTPLISLNHTLSSWLKEPSQDIPKLIDSLEIFSYFQELKATINTEAYVKNLFFAYHSHNTKK